VRGSFGQLHTLLLHAPRVYPIWIKCLIEYWDDWNLDWVDQSNFLIHSPRGGAQKNCHTWCNWIFFLSFFLSLVRNPNLNTRLSGWWGPNIVSNSLSKRGRETRTWVRDRDWIKGGGRGGIIIDHWWSVARSTCPRFEIVNDSIESCRKSGVTRFTPSTLAKSGGNCLPPLPQTQPLNSTPMTPWPNSSS